MRISLVAALTRNHVIGVGNRLPWHLPEDLKRFKALTLGHPVILGRKTYESIGRLLPGRQNLILSRDPSFKVEGAICLSSLDGVLSYCRAKSDEVFIIGGSQIYAQALPLADRLYLTWIDQNIEGDAFFPAFEPSSYRSVSRETREEPWRHSYEVLDRV